jgi:polyhydroxyalkanoate synthase
MATTTKHGTTGVGSNGRSGVRHADPGDGGANDVGLDGLVIQAAEGNRRFVPGMETIRLGSALARRPAALAGRGAELVAELAKVAAGSSERVPARADRRFTDPAWKKNWYFRRLLQAYLAVDDTVHGLVRDADLDWASSQRLEFLADNILDAIAPTNFAWSNPAALKATIDRGGGNFLTGGAQFLRDVRSPAKIPANVDRSKFKVGENLANSPGAVVQRAPQFELLQYTASTTEVREVPLLIVPPMISKYYVVDLSPGRSLVEYLVSRGQQVFAISWHNPGAGNAEWDLDSYVAAVIDAAATARSITGADQVHIAGLCAGGVASACVLGRLADIGEQDTIAGLSLTVTVLDTSRAGIIGSFVSPDTAAAAVARVRKRGFLDKNDLARTFAWLRPNDMIWNYWVNNYLIGEKPPAFDLLFWNSDSMNMPAGLHRDFVKIGMENPLGKAGGISVLGSPVDLSKVNVDTYLVAGETDHITPWPNCYRTTQMLSGESRFIMSTGGHIAAVINPPGNPRATYRVGEEYPKTPEAWLKTAEVRQGTWWEDWDGWLAQRSGETTPAPAKPGSKLHPPIEPAPGTYVLN